MRKILIILILLSSVYAQMGWKEFGAGFNSGSRGSGIHGYWGLFPNEDIGWYGEVRYFDIRGKSEVVTYDYYGNPVTSGGISLAMFTANAGLIYFPFAGKIANNFSPYISLQAGPNLVLNAAEEGGFWERWGNIERHVALSGFIGGGISILTMGDMAWNLAAGYDFLKLREIADGDDNYSGLLIKFSISRRTK